MAMQPPIKTRTTTGCLTCRMRRKRCDQERPRCTGCSRNVLICRWKAGEDTDRVLTQSRGIERSILTGTKLASQHATYRSALPTKGELRSPSMNSLSRFLGVMPGLRRHVDFHLLDHYLHVTAAQLTGRAEPQNPFLNQLIPIASANGAILQCILAVSGAQLYVKSDRYEHSARSHYAASLRSVKHNLLNWRTADTQTLTSLLTATLLLGFFETVIGNINGSFGFHLQASRTILLELREGRIHEADRCMLDLLTEIYAYFAITTNITLHSDSNQKIHQDSFLSSEVLCSLSRGTGNYGVLFGSAHELFALINPIAQSAREFLSHPNDDKRSTQLLQYEKQILSWKYAPSSPTPLAPQMQSPPVVDPYDLAGQIYQHALLIFLHTMFHGAHLPTPSLISTVKLHVALTFALCSTIPRSAFIQTTLLWPVLIASSCLQDSSTRADILEMLQRLPYTTGSIKRMFEFLSILWREMDADENVYGPWGIEKTMIKSGFKMCCA